MGNRGRKVIQVLLCLRRSGCYTCAMFGRIKFTPGFLSISFGVFLLVLSGASGFYVPRQEPEGTALPAVATAADAASHPSAPEESPTGVVAGTGEGDVSPARGTPSPEATSSPAGASSPSPVPQGSPRPSPTEPRDVYAPEPTPVSSPASTPTPTATSSDMIHVVEAGETLLEIAEKYGVSVDELVEANGIGDPNALAVGDKLKIPGR